MKTLAVTLLATVAMIGAAQADDMDVYQTCWAEASTAVLNSKGVTEDTLKEAARHADGMCEYERVAVMASGQSPKEMREYMEVAMYRANPVEETQVAAVAPEQKIENVSGFTPSQSWTPYNARTGFLCQLPLDVEPMRQLVASNRLELARRKRGCVIVEQPIEVERIRGWGWTMEVRYINRDGQLIEAFTSDRTFRTQAEWHALGIE